MSGFPQAGRHGDRLIRTRLVLARSHINNVYLSLGIQPGRFVTPRSDDLLVKLTELEC